MRRRWIQLFALGALVVVATAPQTDLGRPPRDAAAEVGPQTSVAPTSTQPERELIGSGAWSWFGDPRAVYYAGERRQTYVGWIDSSGNVEVSSHDHDTGERAVGTVDSDFPIDDHNSPSIIVRPDGHLVVFWSGHNGPRMYFRRSSAPEDVTSWGPTHTLSTNTAGRNGYTYPNPIQLSAEDDRVYLFWRGGDANPAMSTSDDGGATWRKARRVIDSLHQRPYVKFASNGADTIAMAFTEGHPGDAHTSIYYAAYRDGAFYRADGTRIGTMRDLPLTPMAADRVYDAWATGTKAWVHDVALDSAGNPVIVYATFPTDTDHRYHYARWDGAGWRDVEIIGAGGSIAGDSKEPNYSGGITLDHEDPSTVYLSRQVDGVFEIERWRTPDEGASWIRTPITSGSTRNNYRPVTPRGQSDGDPDVIWMYGSYPGYTTYQTSLRIRGPEPDPDEVLGLASRARSRR